MNQSVPYFRDFPKGHKNEVTQAILNAVKKGRNIQLIGLKGSGISSFFRYLTTSPAEIGDIGVYVIDLNLISERTSESVKKYLIENFFKWETEPGAFTKHSLVLIDSYNNTKGIDEKSLADVFTAILDRHRDYLTFVFSFNREVTNGSHIWGIPIFMTPLSSTDYDWFYKGLGGEDKYKKVIYKTTGGYPALVKRLLEAIEVGDNLDAIIQNPRLNPHVLYQLELMKEGLAGHENYYDVPLYNTFINGAKTNSELTKLEDLALTCLLTHKNELVSRNELITAIWGEGGLDISDHALDQLMHRLKLKLTGKYEIQTVRGRGHKIIE